MAMPPLRQVADESFLARCPRRRNVDAERARTYVKELQEKLATGT